MPEERDPASAPVPARLRDGCWPGLLAQAEGSGPRDTPEKPQPGGHRLTLELPVGGGIAKAKPPREFPFWKLGTSPLMTFSRGGGRGPDTIWVMTSAPGKGLGHGMQVCTGSWAGLGEGACPRKARVCGLSKAPGCPSLGQAVAGMSGFLWAREAMTTSRCCPHSWVPRERDRGCWTKNAGCSYPRPGADPSGQAAPRLLLSGCPFFVEASHAPWCGQAPFPKLSGDTVPKQAAPDLWPFGWPVAGPRGPPPPCLGALCTAPGPPAPVLTPGTLN